MYFQLSFAAVLAAFTAVTSAQNVTYDYVIVGAGTAGMLLAVVLTENPAITVMVLEGGGDGRTDYNITNPERRGTIQHTMYDWQFNTLPQPGLNDNNTEGVQYVPRGKTIGGTSAMNWMIHNEDSRVQLDIWENMLNLTGWNWETLSTAFRESETMYAPPAYEAADLPYVAAYHGSNGPICSTFQRSVMNVIPDYLEPTLKAAGYAMPEDRNGGDSVGYGFLPLAICPQNYTRSYSGSAYTAVEARANLHLRVNSQVTGITWASTSGNVTASGVEYTDMTTGTTSRISARQVILSAGSIQSGQILELSGVGDPAIITPLGIDVVVNLTNVGTGLRDPLMSNYFPISIETTIDLSGNEYAQNFIELESARSVLAPSDFEAASAWLNSTTSIPGLPDIQLQIFKELWNTDQPLIELAWQYTTTNVTPYNLFPLSQGTVHINTSDPLAPPAIDPNYNTVMAVINGSTVPWDFWFLAKASQRYVTQLATIQPMAGVVTSTSPDYSASYEDFAADLFIRTGSSQHITGGNPMLPRDVGGVVDAQMLVYGTSNVRIVDGSIFPYQPSAHPMGVTYAMAVLAARILQNLPGGGGLTFTEILPQSNASASEIAVFPPSSVTLTTASGIATISGGTATTASGTATIASGTAIVTSGTALVASGTAIMVSGTAVIASGTAMTASGSAMTVSGTATTASGTASAGLTTYTGAAAALITVAGNMAWVPAAVGIVGFML